MPKRIPPDRPLGSLQCQFTNGTAGTRNHASACKHGRRSKNVYVMHACRCFILKGGYYDVTAGLYWRFYLLSPQAITVHGETHNTANIITMRYMTRAQTPHDEIKHEKHAYYETPDRSMILSCGLRSGAKETSA